GRQIHLYAGKIDVAAGGEGAGGEDFAADVIVVFGEHFEAHQTAVHEDDVADVGVVDDVLVVDVDGTDFHTAFAVAGPDREIEGLAFLEFDGGIDVASANLGAFDVHHDGDLAAYFLGYGADAADDRARPLVVAVGHVETGNVNPGEDQLPKHFFALGGGAECEDDLGATERGKCIHGVGPGRRVSAGLDGRSARQTSGAPIHESPRGLTVTQRTATPQSHR